MTNVNEEIKNRTIEQIEKYINDVYTLRKNSLTAEGEYSIGNLVFKSLRSKGYLDNLKELKNKLIGKELSLESLQEAAEPMSIQDAVLVSLKYFEGIGIKPEVDEVIEDIAANVPGYEDWQDIAPDDMTRLKGIRFEVTKAMNEYFKESLEQTVEQDLADNRQPVQDNEEKVYKEPVSYKKEIAKEKGLEEDTVKNSKGKWVNKGKEGTHGEFRTKKEADAQRKAMFARGWHEELEERLSEKQRIDYRNELGRISFNQAIIQDNGLFQIYNIKENDIDRIVRQIRDLDYIEWVNKTDSGKYDFSKVVVFGQPQPKYYNITGKIKDSAINQ